VSSVRPDSLLALAEAGDPLPGLSLPWLGQRRQDAATLFAEQGLPTRRDEAWRFTDISDLEKLDFRPGGYSGDSNALSRARSATSTIGESHRLVFLDGVFSREASSIGGLPSGITIDSLASILERQPDHVRERLGSVVSDKDLPLAALNTALFRDGLFVEIRAGQTLSEPIHAIFVHSAGSHPSASFPRSLLIGHTGSRATIVEHHLGCGDGQALIAPVTEVVVEENAQLKHVLLQEQGSESFHLAALGSIQEADSRFESHSLAFGGRVGRADVRSQLRGVGSHVMLNGLYLGAARQTLDHHTTIEHAAPRSTSDENFRGVLGGRARGVFHGRIHVRPDAQKIVAMQQNRNLLVSDQARINTKPQLEIYADDVKCSHGATVGRLDDEQLFYLRSRGIDAADAYAMLTLAFASEIATHLPVTELSKYVEYYIRKWLPGATAR
jgi:Fe-S cluster assembly protein SufD